MDLSIRPLHPLFAGEITSNVALREIDDESTLTAIRAGMDRFAVLVFHNQAFTDQEQKYFAERLDGELNRNGLIGGYTTNRFGDNALVDISNLDANNQILNTSARRRMSSLGNRLWHTDASFDQTRGRYSFLYAREVPPVPADTEFTDLRAAYDELPNETKALIEDLRAHHSIQYSRGILGYEFTAEERTRQPGAIHPLVHTIPGSGRKSLYIASHASMIVDWPVADGRLLLIDLRDHATENRFRCAHRWAVGDLVIWDNRATMHRGLAFEDTKYRRELRRVTTLDLPRSLPDAQPVAIEAAR
jgi:alpha-ketoglutarate-dependent 2,4-dichlorophenoxyacetate dioxygenase